MTKSWFLLGAALCAGTQLFGCPEPPPPSVVIRAGTLIDGTGSAPQHDVRILVHEGVIVDVHPDEDAIPDDAAVLDWRAFTVMPGLVNSHTHLFASGACTPGRGGGAGQAVRNAHAWLTAGVTTVADLGAPAAAAIGLRSYIGTARDRGPRTLVAGPILTAPGGYPTDLGGQQATESGLVRVVATAREGRRIVRELAAMGVDLIKVAVQEQSFNGESLPLLSGEPLCAVVEEAHRQDLRVVAHTTSRVGYESALDCNVDALMHGALEPLDEHMAARIAKENVPVAPTQFVFEAPIWGPHHVDMLESEEVRWLLDEAARRDLQKYSDEYDPEAELLPPMLMEGLEQKRLQSALIHMRRNTSLLHEQGVAIGLGTDSGICFSWHGPPVLRLELERLAASGLSRVEVLSAATRGGARILNLHQAIGTLAPGFRADIIAVGGRPDQSLSALDDVRAVMIDGVVQELRKPGWAAHINALLHVGWSYLTSPTFGD